MNRALRGAPGAGVPFAWSCLARLPGLMTPIAVVAVVQELRQDWAVAGIASALFAAGTAIGSPALGRAMQRFGQPRVTLVCCVTAAALLVAVAVGEARDQPVPLLLALCGGAGLLMPPFTAAMRAVWATLARSDAARDAGFAFDAVAAELLFVVGPLLISGTLLLAVDTLPLLLSAGFVLAGGVGYATSAAVRGLPHGPGGAGERGGGSGGASAVAVLRAPGLALGLAVGSLTAATMGLVDTALIAIAGEKLGHGALLGVLIGAIVAGSVVGGTVYGHRRWAASALRRSAVAQALFAVLTVPVVGAGLLPAGALPALLVTLALFGTMLAPSMILQMAVVDERLAPPSRLFGQACLVGANTAGTAAGTALGGLAVDAFAGPGALACAVPLTVAAAVLALAGTRISSSATDSGANAAGRVTAV